MHEIYTWDDLLYFSFQFFILSSTSRLIPLRMSPSIDHIINLFHRHRTSKMTLFSYDSDDRWIELKNHKLTFSILTFDEPKLRQRRLLRKWWWLRATVEQFSLSFYIIFKNMQQKKSQQDENFPCNLCLWKYFP